MRRKAGKLRESETRDPHAPKNSINAYLMFLRHTEADPQTAQNLLGEETDPTEQGVLVAAKWHSMTDEEQQVPISQSSWYFDG